MVFKGEDGRRDKLEVGINIHILLYNKMLVSNRDLLCSTEN